MLLPTWQGVYMSLGGNHGRSRRNRPASRAARDAARSMIERLEPRQLLSFQGSAEVSHAFAHEWSNAFRSLPNAVEAHADFVAFLNFQSTGFKSSAESEDSAVSPSDIADDDVSTADATATTTPICAGVGKSIVTSSDTTTAADITNAEATTATDMAAASAIGGGWTILPGCTVTFLPGGGGVIASVTHLASGSDFSGYQYINPNGPPPTSTTVVDPNNPEGFEFPPGGGTGVLIGTPHIRPSDRMGSTPVVSQSAPALTPMAQTPAAASAATWLGERAGVSAPSLNVAGSSLTTSNTSFPSALPHAPIYLAPLAMINSGQAVAMAVTPVATEKAAGGLAYASNKAADALSFLASPEGLGDVASYNFVHFNPSVLLSDAIAAFSQESATLSFVPVPTHSTARAWTITAAVVGFDLMLMGYCYHKSRRQKALTAAALNASTHVRR